ncbi:hypothetical protein [Reichenbachiella sp.]|uniref:hypothetical protein n=1 Tax=Reichenbachiella sp. TaxID=2184521 RepID=UPI003BAE6AD5
MNKHKLSTIVFVVNGILFFLGGAGLLGEGKVIFGAIQIVAGACNIAILIGTRKSHRRHIINLLILLMNVVVAGSISWDYTLAGKQYIQYAWLVAALMSLAAFAIQLRKGNTAE